MVWVKSESAGELAVLSTWLVGLAPWSVSIFGEGGFTVTASALFVQYFPGVTLPVGPALALANPLLTVDRT